MADHREALNVLLNTYDHNNLVIKGALSISSIGAIFYKRAILAGNGLAIGKITTSGSNREGVIKEDIKEDTEGQIITDNHILWKGFNAFIIST